ncbi:MAG: hypothetical protein ACRDJK_12730 [Actinomycetota bacterium]
MLFDTLRLTSWAVALGAISILTLADPPLGTGEQALLGRTPPREAGSSNLRLARLEGPVGAGRALLGRLAPTEEQVGSEQAIQIRLRRADGQGALLGRP